MMKTIHRHLYHDDDSTDSRFDDFCVSGASSFFYMYYTFFILCTINKKFMSYKIATIVLAVLLGSVLIVIMSLGATLYSKQFIFSKSFRDALRLANNNNNYHHHDDSPITPPPPLPIPTTSPNLALDAAAFAAHLITLLQNKEPPPPHTRTITHLGPESLGWIVHAPEQQQVWLVFRGTQTKEEWRQDFHMDQVPFHHFLVHRGFKHMYEQLRTHMLDAINSVITESTTLYITGHSLGAAVAALALSDMLASPSSISPRLRHVNCYLFAAPRVGNRAFVDYLQTTTPLLHQFHVIANDDDIVPNIPLPVQPNLEDPATPWIYAQFAMARFADNWGSWTHNHTMPIYISNLTNL